MTCISIEAKHVIMFSKLRNDIVLLACNKSLQVTIDRNWIIVKKCNAIIRTLLKPLVFEKPTLMRTKAM